MIKEIFIYIDKAFKGIKPYIALLISGIASVLFPEKSYFYALVAVSIAAGLDIVTKSYSIIKKNNGYFNALNSGELFSKTLWTGTEVKIFSYLSIALLTGLSYRVVYMKEISNVLASFVYTIMFLREFQSNIENLIEAGADLNWLLVFSKKKLKEKLKENNIENEEEK